MHLLKQSTAASVLVGPVLDSTGAAYTGMAIGDFNITKNGTSAAMASAATATHDHNGHYVIALTTGNTDTLGRLKISCNKATYAMPPSTFEVLAAALFDQIVTNGTAWGTSTYGGADTAGTTTLLSRILGTLAAGTHNPQSGDAYARVNDDLTGIPKILIDTFGILTNTQILMDRIPDAVPGTSGGLPLLDAGGKIAAKLAVSDVSGGNLPAQVKASDNLDFTALQKASITAAVPSASDIAAAVWAATARTLSGFGTLAADVWSATVRTITGGAFSGTASDVAAAVVQRDEFKKLIQKAFGKMVVDRTNFTVKVYAADGVTVLSTGTITSVGSVDTVIWS